MAVECGISVHTAMQAALSASVPGIEGQCGGHRACGTCHVHVPEPWRVIVGPPSIEERELLAFSEDCRPGDRLACQIRITAALNGMELIPAS
jgi:2Fe-2S ferredoxin